MNDNEQEQGLQCEKCHKREMSAELERGGAIHFPDGSSARARDDEYLVIYRCQACGQFHGYAIHNIHDYDARMY